MTAPGVYKYQSEAVYALNDRKSARVLDKFATRQLMCSVCFNDLDIWCNFVGDYINKCEQCGGYTLHYMRKDP